MAILYLSLAFLLNAIANILLKLGSERGLVFAGSPYILLQANWQFFLGLALFALNVIFYFLALRTLPLSMAYPVMVAMGFIIVNTYAWYFLHESIGVGQVLGYALIVMGLVLVVARA